jgi:hypothetical protein
MITSSPYNPRTRERLTRIEAIDGPAATPCHTSLVQRRGQEFAGLAQVALALPTITVPV